MIIKATALMVKRLFCRLRLNDHSGHAAGTRLTEPEEKPGGYVVADITYQVKYIGKAGQDRIIAEIDGAIKRKRDFHATRVKALYMNSESGTPSSGYELIRKYSPPYEKWRWDGSSAVTSKDWQCHIEV